MELTREFKQEEENQAATAAVEGDSSSTTTSSSISSVIVSPSGADRIRKRIELESLAQSLKTQLPDARQCAQCGFGPQLHTACNDLHAHHEQALDEDGNVTINNACPECGWLADSWVTLTLTLTLSLTLTNQTNPNPVILTYQKDDWLPWNGSLPTAVSGTYISTCTHARTHY